MKHILFVVDEPRVLDAHRARMQNQAAQTESTFALGLENGLEALRTSRFDAVVSDLRVREAEGVFLLGAAKEDYPDLVRITLCSPSEMDSIFAALPVSHQILSLPLNTDTLCNVIDRTLRLRNLLTDSLRKRIGGVDQLPSVPAVYHELMASMARPDISVRKVARIVEKDAAMAAKVLQLVNSACFGLMRTITSVDHAVVHLGMELVRDLSLTVHVFASLERSARRSGISLDTEQEHSVLAAKVAKRIVPNRQQAQAAFTAALLHDIGNLVLAVCIPEKFRRVSLTCEATGRPTHEVESELLGMTHAEVGAYLLGLWGLPCPIVEAVAYHHNPAAALENAFDLPTVVGLANALVEEAAGRRPAAMDEHLKSLRILDKLPQWRAIAREEVQHANRQLAFQ